MKKILAIGIILSALASSNSNAQSLSGLSKKGTDMVSDAKTAGSKASADAFVSDLQSKLKLSPPQSSQIKPLAEKMFKDVTDVEASDVAADIKSKNVLGLYSKFDKKLKGILTKSQWTKYLDVVKSYRK